MEKRRSWISVVLSLIFLVSLLFILGNLDIQGVQAADYTASVEFNMDAASQPAQTKTFTVPMKKSGILDCTTQDFGFSSSILLVGQTKRDYTATPMPSCTENQSISEAFPEGTTGTPKKLYHLCWSQ